MKQSSSNRMRLENNNNNNSSKNTNLTENSAATAGFNFSSLLASSNYEKSILNVCNNLFYQSLLDCATAATTSATVTSVNTTKSELGAVSQSNSGSKSRNSFHINQILPELFNESSGKKNGGERLENGSVRILPIMLPKRDVTCCSEPVYQSSTINKIERMLDKMNGVGKSVGVSGHQSGLVSNSSLFIGSDDDIGKAEKLQRLNYIQNFLLMSKTTDEVPSKRTNLGLGLEFVFFS